MAQILGQSFGDGSDGVVTLSGTESPVADTCSGTSGTTSLSATNAGFEAGQLILIHQAMGTGVGVWELNKIASYTAGTITTDIPLANTYNSYAGVRVIKQYRDVTISGSYEAGTWNTNNIASSVIFFCSGTTTISGTVTTSGIGYPGGADPASAPSLSGQGDIGERVQQTAANGSGGGGSGAVPEGAGGGGNGTAGQAGTAYSGTPGAGGGTAGSADLTSLSFGGGGGGSLSSSNNAGGKGGGIIAIFSKTINVTGSMVANGGNGGNGTAGGDGGGGSGGGAGGSILIKAQTASLGSSLITATGGTGGTGNISAGDGGNGGDGRIRVEACNLTGTTNPSASTSIGSHNWCNIFGGMI